MLKKLLYLYNDGHNPFPHLKGKGLHLIDGEYEYDGNPDDEQVYDGGFIIGNYAPNNDGGFLVMSDDNGVFEVNRHEKDIEPPDYYKYSTSIYDDDDDNDAAIFGYNDDDDELQSINTEIIELKKNETEFLNGKTSDELRSDLNELKLQEKELKKDDIKNNIEKSKFKKQIESDSEKIFLDVIGKLMDKNPKIGLLMDNILTKTSNTIISSFAKNMSSEQISELITNEISNIGKYAKTNDRNAAYILYSFLSDFKETIRAQQQHYIDVLHDILLATGLFDGFDKLQLILDKTMSNYEKKGNIEKQKSIIENKINVSEEYSNEIKLLQQQYGERKKLIEQKKRLATIKQLQLTDPEQALKDSLELNAELKEKAALETGKKLSKAAQKKANTAAKKEAAEKQAEKQAEASVFNAQLSLKTKGTYGKKLEDFFASNGQPILQKFTGDTSKIKDIEKDDVIPDEIVTFNDGKQNSLRKACTLDLYNNKYVFEIKNYVNNSIDDAVIPMQPSKFAGTDYFKPRYLEDGSLYSLNLNYTSPITGIHHTQNILPANTNGREVVFVIRLKEGLYQYKPFLDHKNTSIIPTGETTQDGRLLYFFDSTKLKKCKDYKGNPAFNLKGHLTPI